MIVAVLEGALPAAELFRWLGLAVAGNVAGGVVIVALIDDGQVKKGH